MHPKAQGNGSSWPNSEADCASQQSSPRSHDEELVTVRKSVSATHTAQSLPHGM